MTDLAVTGLQPLMAMALQGYGVTASEGDDGGTGLRPLRAMALRGYRLALP